jgi:hypothetical protein
MLSTDLKKKYQNINFLEIRKFGSGLFQLDGLAEVRWEEKRGVMKLIVAFRNFANVPKNISNFAVHV